MRLTLRNKNNILLCSKRGDTLISGALDSQVQILDHVSEELFVKAMNGERIIDEDDTEGTCSSGGKSVDHEGCTLFARAPLRDLIKDLSAATGVAEVDAGDVARSRLHGRGPRRVRGGRGRTDRRVT
ncbi:hypothetical protein B0H13DRAFT_2303734 [Mycena leptocephala]|nr:hypothetical protein B0H13DRAFT_2303734 [Mycena leptocephala]